jgi:hypothetical protein
MAKHSNNRSRYNARTEETTYVRRPTPLSTAMQRPISEPPPKSSEQQSSPLRAPPASKGQMLAAILAAERDTLQKEQEAEDMRAMLTAAVAAFLESFGERVERTDEQGQATGEITWRHAAFSLPSGEVVQPILKVGSTGKLSGHLRHLTAGEVVDPEQRSAPP